MQGHFARLTGICLLLVIAGMLSLGAAEDVVKWFAVQLVPAVLALVLVVPRNPLGVYGAPPVFLFWLLMLVLLAMFLASGAVRHGWWEMVLTAAVGGVCGLGIAVSFREAAGGSAARRRLVFAAFVAFQIGACCLSFPFFEATGAV